MSKQSLLGDVLYPGQRDALVFESEWLDLVHAAYLGNVGSLRALFDRTQPLVFALIGCILGERRLAEELTINVFHDIWIRASKYTLEQGTVVAWLMNEARRKANENLPHAARGSFATEGLTSVAAQLSGAMWAKLSRQIDEVGKGPVRTRESAGLRDTQWREVAPGIACKLLATDTRGQRVSMLVRLVPGGEYPGHEHAGTEELHLLEGELWIDDRRLYPGDYNRAIAGTADARVWTKTGCMCVLITSTQDRLA